MVERQDDGSKSFYFFDIDDNLLFLPTRLYLWNAETKSEQAITSGDFARIQNQLGRAGPWQSWAIGPRTFRDFRDTPGAPSRSQPFIKDLMGVAVAPAARRAAAADTPADRPTWQGPSWPLLVHCAKNQRAIAMVTARGHEPATIEAGLRLLVKRGFLPGVPPILGIYTVTNEGVRARVGADDPDMTVPSIKKLAIKHAVRTALEEYGAAPPHRFGMSDDDPNNVVLAVSAMRDCKLEFPDKRFFVINTNHEEFVKLEIFPMEHPVTASKKGKHLLNDTGTNGAPAAAGRSPPAHIRGGNASVYVSDMDRAVGFYTKSLGLTLRVRVGTDWAEIDAGNGLTIGLHPASPPQTPAPGTGGAINIELAVTGRLEQVVATLKRRGVKFTGPIAAYPAVKLVPFADPDGNVLLLAEVLHSGKEGDPAA